MLSHVDSLLELSEWSLRRALGKASQLDGRGACRNYTVNCTQSMAAERIPGNSPVLGLRQKNINAGREGARSQGAAAKDTQR
jgi:hypothetical protein